MPSAGLGSGLVALRKGFDLELAVGAPMECRSVPYGPEVPATVGFDAWFLALKGDKEEDISDTLR